MDSNPNELVKTRTGTQVVIFFYEINFIKVWLFHFNIYTFSEKNRQPHLWDESNFIEEIPTYSRGTSTLANAKIRKGNIYFNRNSIIKATSLQKYKKWCQEL